MSSCQGAMAESDLAVAPTWSYSHHTELWTEMHVPSQLITHHTVSGTFVISWLNILMRRPLPPHYLVHIYWIVSCWKPCALRMGISRNPLIWFDLQHQGDMLPYYNSVSIVTWYCDIVQFKFFFPALDCEAAESSFQRQKIIKIMSMSVKFNLSF